MISFKLHYRPQHSTHIWTNQTPLRPATGDWIKPGKVRIHLWEDGYITAIYSKTVPLSTILPRVRMAVNMSIQRALRTGEIIKV